MTVFVSTCRQYDISRFKTTETRTAGTRVIDLNTSDDNFEMLNFHLNHNHVFCICNTLKDERMLLEYISCCRKIEIIKLFL